MSYPKATQDALRKALSRPTHQRTTAQRVLVFLDGNAGEGGWVDARMLHMETTHKAASRLSDLRRIEGVAYEQRRDPASPKGRHWTQYRLVQA